MITTILALAASYLPQRVFKWVISRRMKPWELLTEDVPRILGELYSERIESSLKEVAHGSTCRVYKIKHNDVQRACKVYGTDSHSLKCFENEVKVYKHLKRDGVSHDRIVRSASCYLPVINMPFYRMTLEAFIDYLKNDTSASVQAMSNARWLVASALAHEIATLHDNDVVHCDIKPGNIAFENSYEDILGGAHPRIVLCDFGASMCRGVKCQSAPGTQNYQAPEILHGRSYGAASDWWSYACVVFELLTGRVLFDVYSEEGTVYDAEEGESCTESCSSRSNLSSRSMASFEEEGESDGSSSKYSVSKYSDEADAETQEYHHSLIDYLVGPEAKFDEVFNLNNTQPCSNAVSSWLRTVIKSNLVIEPSTRLGSTTRSLF